MPTYLLAYLVAFSSILVPSFPSFYFIPLYVRYLDYYYFSVSFPRRFFVLVFSRFSFSIRGWFLLFGIHRSTSVCSVLVGSGLVCVGLVWFGLVRSGIWWAWIGLRLLPPFFCRPFFSFLFSFFLDFNTFSLGFFFSCPYSLFFTCSISRLPYWVPYTAQ